MTTRRLKRLWDPQLSDHEVHFIGMIFIQWASLEHEIFVQTVRTFDSEAKEVPELPKELNNIQFTAVLELWKERVADAAPKGRAKVLRRQYEKILTLKQARDALAHGMWHWSPEDLGRIGTVRVKKRQIITSHFSAKSLGDMASDLGEINFKIRFPGGLIDLVRARMQEGGYMSRRAVAMFSGAPVDDDGYPTAHPTRTRARRARRADG
ncbi:hypothetical protein [Methyloversatilis sp. MC4-4]|uniref:hypothetical protein n=1 Tax=Methyloversatilis sp. MC4-4 TaxID=3132824 RepID=UPI003CF31EBE